MALKMSLLYKSSTVAIRCCKTLKNSLIKDDYLLSIMDREIQCKANLPKFLIMASSYGQATPKAST